MTTLELARAIADAVLACPVTMTGPYSSLRWDDSTQDAPTQAVLRVLHDTDSWFCRLSEDHAGCTVQTPYEHPELF
jgi:hypothetical protein